MVYVALWRKSLETPGLPQQRKEDAILTLPVMIP